MPCLIQCSHSHNEKRSRTVGQVLGDDAKFDVVLARFDEHLITNPIRIKNGHVFTKGTNARASRGSNVISFETKFFMN